MGLFGKKKKKEVAEGEAAEDGADMGEEIKEQWVDDAFDLYQKGGKVDGESMVKIFTTFGANPAVSEVNDIKKKAGSLADVKGALDDDKLFKKEAYEDVRSILASFDREKKGLIDALFFRHVLSLMGDALSEAELDAIFTKLRTDGDGMVGIDDVTELLVGNSFVNTIAPTAAGFSE
eukprot:c4387_g1_i1.p1 GENE.c4387_g1_i1~~c4387_g1_i1.p1  ORF type:complete len:184 (+),score=15.10 c4387_g1_i1:23-553(+)